MWQLYQFPLCPFSRKVRLLLGEKGVGYDLVRESPWDRRDEFLDMNPAGQVPVMADPNRNILLMDSMAICEYLEETVDKAAMINGTAVNRAEIRRLVAWFDTQYFQDVTAPLLGERMMKRLVTKASPTFFRRARAIFGVWTFFAIIHIWDQKDIVPYIDTELYADRITPEVAAPLSSHDYFAGRDPALAAILARR